MAFLLFNTVASDSAVPCYCAPLKRRGLFQEVHVFQAIIAGDPADRSRTLPVIEHTADIFAGCTGHIGNISLAEFVVNEGPPVVQLLAEGFGQLQQGLGDPAGKGRKDLAARTSLA